MDVRRGKIEKNGGGGISKSVERGGISG